jgi:hypothetical protein
MSMQLKRSTLAQGQTLTDLEYTMVLDNIAMQRQMPGALPWHLKVTQGSVQIDDNIAGSFDYSWDSGVGSFIDRTLGVNGGRTWQESWTVVPEIDTAHLTALQTAYSKYVDAPWIHNGPPPPLSICGHYGPRCVWVKTADVAKLTQATLDVLHSAPVAPGDRGIILPGPPL